MIVDKNIQQYIIQAGESIHCALTKLNLNSKKIIFCVDEAGVLKGAFSDGDFRRWAVNTIDLDLAKPIISIASRDFVSSSNENPKSELKKLFSNKISSVPLVDSLNRVIAIAWNDEGNIQIGGHSIGGSAPTFIIAEIGNNHNGSLDSAKRLIESAAEAGADCVKFQLRDLASLYTKGVGDHSEDLGTEYTLDLLKRFQLTDDEMFTALDCVKDHGLVPLCTPWDIASLEKLSEYGLDGFKIASADLTNHDLIVAATRMERTLILSTGMSKESEIRSAVDLLYKNYSSFALLHCNSTYPAPMQDINLSYMDRLKKISNRPVGYSGHERGFEICIAAVAMGAKIIEKHFTSDRLLEGNDHRVSLLPNEFQDMVKSIRNVELSIGEPGMREVTQGEKLNREVLAKSLVASKRIVKGEIIEEDMIKIISPGRGLQPSSKNELIGKASYRDIDEGDIFFDSDIKGKAIQPRKYSFNRPWGIPVRYHDFYDLTNAVDMDLVEIHFSYKDLDLNPKDFISNKSELDLVVHSPELFEGDHLLDLSSDNVIYRNRSIDELQKVIDRTCELKDLFPNTKRPLIVVNAGGFSADNFIPIGERDKHYENIANALISLDTSEVELIPQTMPPFPWHFGGQRFHNLFMDPAEISKFCNEYGFRICLDISHSKLACNYFKWSLSDFIEQVSSYTAHLHIVDARGHRDEGLQIGAGEIDFFELTKTLEQYLPGTSFIPEIWQGHKNAGEGFWIAFNELEGYFDSLTKQLIV